LKVTTNSETETRAFGERLGRLLEPGDFIGLVGPMGAGKTTFVRGVAEGAGVQPNDVASPSFAIVYPYRGRLTLNHVDLYRVGDAEERYATGYFDGLDGNQAVIVEWIDRIPEAAPDDRLEIRFTDLGGDQRELVVRAFGRRALACARALRAR
jgi:tRNA threonylcarbamoyladenosine biosynthesis protein TsaE